MTVHHSDSAFPLHPDLATTSPDGFKVREGLTKREYIAVELLAAIVTSKAITVPHLAVKKAIESTDALIAELNQTS